MDKVVKIVYFAFSEKYGASHAGFTHSYNIVKALSRYLKVTAFFSSEENLEIKLKNLEIMGVNLPNTKKIIKLNPLKYFSSFLNIKRIVKKADLIHERFHINPIDLLFVGDKYYVLEINDPAMVLYSGIKGILYRYLINLKLNRCDAIITQTKTLANILNKYTKKPVFVISNGVDTKSFRPKIKNTVRKDLHIKNGDIVVIFVGSFMQWHGVHDVLNLAKIFPKVKFLMIGSGPLFNDIKNRSKNIENIILLGPKSNFEIPKFLSAADMAIAPFNTKKFNKLDEYGFWWCPVKLFEYMASGKPVVSYDYYEVRNIIQNGGLLATPGDFDDFVKKFTKLLNSGQLRTQLGIKARKLSLMYDWKCRGGELYKIYNKILE